MASPALLLGPGKRLSLDDLFTLSLPLFNILSIDDGILNRLDELWKITDEAKNVPVVQEYSVFSGDLSASLAPAIVRAGISYRVSSLVNGKSVVRKSVVETLIALVNNQVTPLLSTVESGAKELVAFIAGQGKALLASGEVVEATEALKTINLQPLTLYRSESNALLSFPFLTVALACLVAHGAQQLSKVVDCVSALSCEAVGAKIEAFDASLFETLRPHRGQMLSATNHKALFEGSKRVIAGFSGADERWRAFHGAPQSHGAVVEVLASASKALDIELNAADLWSMNPDQGIATSEVQASVYLRSICEAVQTLTAASQERVASLVSIASLSVPSVSSSSLEHQPAAYALAVQLVQQQALDV
jgi:histidine ammonia-lyase